MDEAQSIRTIYPKLETPSDEGDEHQVIVKTIKVEAGDPKMLLNQANNAFHRHHVAKASRLSYQSYKLAENDYLKAQATYQLARCFHSEKNYIRAFELYFKAVKLHNDFIPAHFGLGQMHIQRKNYTKAVYSFEYVLKHLPNCTDTLKILGSLYIHTGKENLMKKAVNLLTKYLHSFPDDIEVLIDLAQLLENNDPNKSLQLYEKVEKLITATGKEIVPDIINNIASLYFSIGKYGEALEKYREAEDKLIEMIATEDSEDVDMLVSVKYNIARCMESLHMNHEATQCYNDILKEDPNYIECIIRRACLAHDEGRMNDAHLLFKEAAGIESQNADAMAMLGIHYMKKNELNTAQQVFENIVQKSCPEDALSHVILGNIWLQTLFNPLRNKEGDKKAYDHALVMFNQALKIQPKNIWAANGIGCILAHKKRWQEARDVFFQVREATSEFCDVWVNIAHIYMETRQYVPAIQMYSNAMKKFGKEKDHNMLVSLARAYYASGKLQECRETLERAMIESADNIQVKFNYAFILKKMSKRILEDTKATSIMVNGAIVDLRTAERMFTYIHKNRDESLTNFKLVSRTASGEEAKQCQDLLKQAETYLTRALEQDRLEEEMRRKQEAERASLLQKIQQQKMDKESKAERRREEIATLRTAFKEMTRDCLRMPEVKEDEKKPRGGGRRRKGGDGDEFVNDSSDMGNWPGDGEEGGERRQKEKSSKRAARKRREKKVIIGSGTDDEAEKPPKKKKKFEKTETKLSAKQSAKSACR